jgi:hypothetical protein
LEAAMGADRELACGGIADKDRHPARAQELADGIEEQSQGMAY